MEGPKRKPTTGWRDIQWISWDCDDCGHQVRDHDDKGCLWQQCSCGLPGERK